jgi:hypothetical protein
MLKVLYRSGPGPDTGFASAPNSHTSTCGAAGREYGESKEERQTFKAEDLPSPHLEQARNAVLNSLPAASSQESYGHVIDEFIGWYCLEPRLAFNRTVALRYRFFLEQNNLAPSTINVRVAAVRCLAYEAADTGMLGPPVSRRKKLCGM